MFSFTSLLIHQVNCLSIVAHVLFQGGCLILATFATALLVFSCFHDDKSPDDPLPVAVILGSAFIMWYVVSSTRPRSRRLLTCASQGCLPGRVSRRGGRVVETQPRT
jgi:hypothetical protein